MLLCFIGLLAMFLSKGDSLSKLEPLWLLLPMFAMASMVLSFPSIRLTSIRPPDIFVACFFTLLLLANYHNHKLHLYNASLLQELCAIGLFVIIRCNNDLFTEFRISSCIAMLFVLQLMTITAFNLSDRSMFANALAFANKSYGVQFLAVGLPALWHTVNYTVVSKNVRRTLQGISFLVVFSLALWFESRISLFCCLVFCLYQVQSIRGIKLNPKFLFPLCFLTFFSFTFLKPASSTGRLLIWEVTLKNWRTYLFHGVGSGGFQVEYPTWQKNFFEANGSHRFLLNADDIPVPFNGFLLVLVENGFFALLCLLIALVLSFRFQFKNLEATKPTSPAFIGAVMLLVQMFTSNIFNASIFKLLMFALLAVLINPQTNQNNCLVLESRQRRRYLRLLTAFFGIGLFLMVAARYISYMRACIQWRHLNRAAKVQQYLDLYPALNTNREFLYEFAYALYKEKHYQKASEILDKMNLHSNSYEMYTLRALCNIESRNFKKAIQDCQYNSNYIPHRLYPKYLLMKSYLLSGDSANALFMAKIIDKMKPKVESHLTNAIQLEARQTLKAK